MSMIHRRTMKIEYDERIEREAFAKLSNELHKKGLSLVGSYLTKVDESHYGYVTVKDSPITTCSVNDKVVLASTWKSSVNEIYLALDNIIGEDENYSLTLTESTNEEKKWITPQGETLHITNEDMEGELNFGYVHSELHYEQPNGDLVTLRVEIERFSVDIELRFIVEHKASKKISPALLKTYLEDVPLKDMKLIKSLFTSRCALKNINYDISDYTIDCNYQLIAISTSECSPATVAKLMRDDDE